MTEEEISQWATKLIQRFDNTKIVGSGGEWSGNARQGFAFNPRLISPTEGTTPVTPTGACCPEEGDCFISTQSVCEGGGGTYQGDSTTCDPDPCPPPIPTGACCVGTDCTIETETDCTGMGGTYQGDDTVCDPNPCVEPPCCPGAFNAFDGSGRKFLTQTITASGNCSFPPPPGNFVDATTTWNSVKTSSYDPDTCDLSCLATGSVDCDGGDWTCGGGHHDSGTPSCAGVGTCDSFIDSILNTSTECVWNLGIGCTTCCAIFSVSGVIIPISETEQQITWDRVDSADQFVHATQTITLSDECTP